MSDRQHWYVFKCFSLTIGFDSLRSKNKIIDCAKGNFLKIPFLVIDVNSFTYVRPILTNLNLSSLPRFLLPIKWDCFSPKNMGLSIYWPVSFCSEWGVVPGPPLLGCMAEPGARLGALTQAPSPSCQVPSCEQSRRAVRNTRQHWRELGSAGPGCCHYSWSPCSLRERKVSPGEERIGSARVFPYMTNSH